MLIRKTQLIKETVFAEAGEPSPVAIRRVAALAVIVNPFAGKVRARPVLLVRCLAADRRGFDVGGRPPHGRTGAGLWKAAIVGVNGDLEHAAAVLHPKLGKPMRAAIGGGEAIIPSTTKVAAAGASIDVPLANKDNPWSMDELDSITVALDAPRPDEILVVMAIGTAGRPNPRVGKGRAIT